jgi:hypothetical protein
VNLKKSNKMKKMTMTFKLLTAFMGFALLASSCVREGCTDPIATNYDDKANEDDGSCLYNPDGGDDGVISSEITEDIDVNTTISAGTYKICADIDINAVLTVEPGVTFIMCSGASIEVTNSGALKAIGTAAAPIVFKGEVASSGYWDGIRISSNNPNNQFDHVMVSDGGTYWAWAYALVYLPDGGQLNIKNSTISNADNIGLYASNTATLPTFENNTFSNNTIVGLNISARQIGSLDAASVYNDGNGEPFIHARGASLGSNQTWKKLDTPVLMNDALKVEAGLTINPGFVLWMETGSSIQVEESGYLTAVGTATEPITIQGRYSSPGYWQGMTVRSVNPNNKLNYVHVSDGGAYWAYQYAGINVDGRLEMNNSIVTNSNSWGLYMQSSSSIYCAGVMQTDPTGVTAVNTMTGNGEGPDADCEAGGCTVYFE